MSEPTAEHKKHIRHFTFGDIIRGNLAPNPEAMPEQLAVPAKFLGDILQGIKDSYLDEEVLGEKGGDNLERQQFILRLAHQVVRSPIFVGDEHSVGTEKAIRIWNILYAVFKGKLGLQGIVDWHLHPDASRTWIPSETDILNWSVNKNAKIRAIGFRDLIALFVETEKSMHIGGVDVQTLDYDNKEALKLKIQERLTEQHYCSRIDASARTQVRRDLVALRWLGFEVYLYMLPLTEGIQTLPDTLTFERAKMP